MLVNSILLLLASIFMVEETLDNALGSRRLLLLEAAEESKRKELAPN